MGEIVRDNSGKMSRAQIQENLVRNLCDNIAENHLIKKIVCDYLWKEYQQLFMDIYIDNPKKLVEIYEKIFEKKT